MWRMQNAPSAADKEPPKPEETVDPDAATFTEITLDVRPDDLSNTGGEAPWMRR